MIIKYKYSIKTFVETFCLNMYLGFFLEILAYTGKFAYRVISITGHWFRSREVFASTFGKGVLINAEINLEKSGVVAFNKIGSIIKEYLCFESRFVLENIWIRKKFGKYIIQAFDPADLKQFKKKINNGSYVIATPHNSSLYMLVALVSQLNQSAFFLVMNPFSLNLKRPTPVQKSLLKLFSVWPKHQEFVFLEDSDVFDKSCAVLKSGKSLIIAPDTPSSSEKKVTISFMGKSREVAAGTAVMAKRCQVPVMVVVPWAESCIDPYKLNIKIIAAEEISQCMCEVFDFFQAGIEMNPACWSGWLYWDN